jgi:prepilin peptidase CpaA
VHHIAIIDLLLIVGLILLAFSGLHDFGFRTVPNWVSAALFCLGAALRLLDGSPHGLLWSLGISFAVLLFTFMFWRFGWMGGGDVKLLTAAAMFVPPPLVPFLISGTALAGGALSILYLAASLLVKRPRGARPQGFLGRVLRCEHWRLSRRGPLPYAAAIAAGGWIATLHA